MHIRIVLLHVSEKRKRPQRKKVVRLVRYCESTSSFYLAETALLFVLQFCNCCMVETTGLCEKLNNIMLELAFLLLVTSKASSLIEKES